MERAVRLVFPSQLNESEGILDLGMLDLEI